ncbi:MAG: AraC family transcriptional regulator ligand-binding domain-containing protein, partial [Myxococcota bacterium]
MTQVSPLVEMPENSALLDRPGAVAEPVKVVTVYDIDAANVRPAFEASLRCGASEDELGAEVGWRRAELEHPGAVVSGASTYQHMELMYRKPHYERFVLAAVRSHTAASLGVVGMACRSCATLAQAFECHRRYQHLINRTATYEARIDGSDIAIRETRFGEIRLGSFLISDYTMLVAIQLLRQITSEPPAVRCMR